MAELLASAALVRQASLVTSLTAIYSTVHPHNVACRSALEKIGADLCSVSDVFGSTPYLDVALRERLDAYDARGWTEPPLVAVLGPSVVQHAAQLMIAAASAEGLAWDGGARVYLEGPWTDGGEAPPGERAGGLLSQIRAMARGEVPEIALQVDADNRVRLRA
jgi:hypothetical protein